MVLLNHVVFYPTTDAKDEAKGLAGAAKAIILLHGLTSAYQTFLNVLQPLADRSGLAVVGMDLRGHGRSPEAKDPLGYTLEEMAADIRETLDSVQFRGSIIILGHSWGSRIALQFASQNAGRIAAVVVEDEYIRATLKEGPPQDLDVLRERVTTMKAAWQDSFESHEALLHWFDTSVGEAKQFGLQDYTNKIGSSGEGESKKWFSFMKPHVEIVWHEFCRIADMNSVWKGVGQYPFPIHIMAGGGDEFKSDVSDEDYAELLAQATELSADHPGLRTISRIHGAGHVVHRTNQDEFLQDFLQGAKLHM